MSDKRIGNEQFITIWGWMRNIPDIQNNTELMAYALIYGFSQTKEQCLSCKQSYIAGWLKISRPKCCELLNRMERKGLIQKILVRQHGIIKQYKYRCILPSIMSSEREHDEFPNVTRVSSQAEHATGSQREHIDSNIYNNILYISSQEKKRNHFYDYYHQNNYNFEQLEMDLLKNNRLMDGDGE